MNNAKKFLPYLFGLLLAVLIVMPSKAYAQMCSWDLEVNGKAYSSTADYAKNGTLTFSGSTVTLNNFSGQTIEAVPGGFYGDDDAPVLTVVLKGTNYLYGGTLSDSSFGAIQSVPREGGSGAGSEVIITGDGTLNMTRNFYPNSGCDTNLYAAIYADTCVIKGSAKVNIDYSVAGLSSAYSVSGIWAGDANFIENSITNIKLNTCDAYASQYSTSPTVSSCPVYGVNGDAYVNLTSGYVSINTNVSSNSGSKIYCANGGINVASNTSVLYLRNAYGKTFVPGTGSIKKVSGLGQTATATNSAKGLNCCAIVPTAYNYYNPALTYIDAAKLADRLEFGPSECSMYYGMPAYADASSDGFYYKDLYGRVDYATGQVWADDDMYHATAANADESHPDDIYIYESYLSVVPAPGYILDQTQDGDYQLAQRMRDNTGFAPDRAGSSWSGVSAWYMYAQPTIKTQLLPNYCMNSVNSARVDIADFPTLTETYGETVVFDPDFLCEWFLRVTENGATADIPMSTFGGDMDGFCDLDTAHPTFGFDETYKDFEVTVGSGKVKLADADKLEIYCTVSSICDEVKSNVATVDLFGHNLANTTVTKAVTCTADGEKSGTCTLCGAVVKEVIPTTGHNIVTDKAVAATCTKTGLTEGKHCSVCNTVLTKQEVVPVKAHTVVADKAVAATYTKTGKTEGSHCSACNTVIKAQETVAMKKLAQAKITSVTNTSTGITVKWNKVTGATAYQVYRKVGTGSWKLIKTTTSTSLTNTKLTNGSKYQYKVRAIAKNSSGTIVNKGAYSAIKTMYRLTRPTLASGTKNIATKKIVVKWNKNTKATGYQIKYVKGSTTKTVKVTKASTLSKTLSKLTKGSTYKVSVRSYKTVSGTTYYSAYSAVKSVKVAK